MFVLDGAEVLVHSMDRLGRNPNDLRAIVRRLTANKVRVEFVREQLAFTSEENAMANLRRNIMGAFAEFERSLVWGRQYEGIAFARQRGAYRGHKRVLTPTQAAALQE